MNFIKVSCRQCTAQGVVVNQYPPTEMHLNIDLVALISRSEVYLKGGAVLTANGNHFTNFRLAPGVNVNEI